MPDLLDDIRTYAEWLDDVESPVMGDEARRRPAPVMATADEAPELAPAEHAGPRGRRRALLAAAAVLVAIALVSGVVALTRDHDEAGQVDIGPEPGLARGWNQIAAPPFAPRDGAATAWTGRYLVVWGGSASRDTGPALEDGWVYDASTSQWRAMARSPLAARRNAVTGWTGDAVGIWGGHSGTAPLNDGALYDPAANTWRELPAAPFEPSNSLAAIWAGPVLFVHDWPNSEDIAELEPALLLDTRTGQWDASPPELVDRYVYATSWTGRVLLVKGETPDVFESSSYSSPVLLEFDPSDGAWRSLPLAGVSYTWELSTPDGLFAALPGDHTVLWDGTNAAVEQLPVVEEPGRDCSVQMATAAREVVVFACGNASAFDLDSRTWRPFDDIDLGEGAFAPDLLATVDGHLALWGRVAHATDGAPVRSLGWIYQPDDGEVVAPDDTTPTPTTLAPAPQLDSGWHDIPAPPDDFAWPSGAGEAWTGRYYVVWGGAAPHLQGISTPTDRGIVYDAVDGVWRTMADGPLTARLLPSAVVVGGEILFVGGTNGADLFYEDVALYDPAANTWRSLADVPFAVAAPTLATDDDEVFLYQSIPFGLSLLEADEPDRAAILDVERGQWEVLDDPPDTTKGGTDGLGAAWTDAGVLVWGLGDEPDHVGYRNIAFALDPASRRWTELPTTGDDRVLVDQMADAVWTGDTRVSVNEGEQLAELNGVPGMWA
jgi:hypothetical protein